jgi:hypothetical protein
MLKRIAKDDVGKVIISVILGLGISALFRKVCNDRDCIVIRGPPISEIEKKVYSFDGRCYKYKAQSTSCQKN